MGSTRHRSKPATCKFGTLMKSIPLSIKALGAFSKSSSVPEKLAPVEILRQETQCVGGSLLFLAALFGSGVLAERILHLSACLWGPHQHFCLIGFQGQQKKQRAREKEGTACHHQQHLSPVKRKWNLGSEQRERELTTSSNYLNKTKILLFLDKIIKENSYTATQSCFILKKRVCCCCVTLQEKIQVAPILQTACLLFGIGRRCLKFLAKFGKMKPWKQTDSRRLSAEFNPINRTAFLISKNVNSRR